MPSPALTKIYISDDSKYIVCLSKIKLDNPYQLVIVKKNGRLIKKIHIAPIEAQLSKEEFLDFKFKYPGQFRLLSSLNSITYKKEKIYIDFYRMNMPKILGEAWDYLIKKEAPSHFSKNFSESVTNWIFWYKEPDPEMQLKYKGEELFSVSLLDPKGERFEIPIHEPRPEEVLNE